MRSQDSLRLSEPTDERMMWMTQDDLGSFKGERCRGHELCRWVTLKQRSDMEQPIFDVKKLKCAPWWFKFIEWMLPSSIGQDGDSWLEVKRFRGCMYVTRFGQVIKE